MKLKKVTIEGFRGAPKLLELPLDGKSLCLLGENGRGKTTIVDGLEYWSIGKLENFARERYGLEATINLDHGSPATITCERQGHPTLRRTLRGSKPDQLEVVGPAAIDSPLPPPLPILRHSTMARFMSQSPGEKKRALLGVLGLESLLEFRDTIVTAANLAKTDADDAKRRTDEEHVTLEAECAGLDLLSRAEALRKDAGLSASITSETDLLELDFAKTPAVEVRVDRAELVESVARAADAVGAQPVTDWNDAVADRATVEAAALHALVEAGQNVLETWGEEACPLCLAPHDRDALSRSLVERAAELAERNQALRTARSGLDAHRASTQALATAINAVTDAPPAGGWPKVDKLAEIARNLEAHAVSVVEALAKTGPSPTPKSVSIAPLLDDLRKAAVSDEQSPAVAALAQLERLRIALSRTRGFERKEDAKHQVASAVDELRAFTEEGVRLAVQAAINNLGAVAADFYGRLVKNPVYSEISLHYTEGRKGGIEFALTYDQRHSVTPPQRVVSESQLNALGLAFFLARLKVEPTLWRTLVLDDVVNSFDGDHRMGLAALLSEEFGAWQILFFTHDNMFATLGERFISGWRFWQIVAWNPKEGPILSEGDPLKRLTERLDAGESASDLGGLARVALERGLSRPLERLGLPIRFDRRQLYSAPEYLDALQTGLAERGSSLKDLPVIKRMRGQSYLVNLGAHDRPTDPVLSTEDLRQMVEDLGELARGFTCANCSKPVWETRKGFESYQCQCSKLAV